MNDYRIYLAGAMSCLSYDEYMAWRVKFTHDVNALAHDYEIKQNVVIFNPCSYYNFEEKLHKTEREPFEFDLYNLKRSDLVVANLNNQYSIGTCMELAIAKDRQIPVIGLKENDSELHPWISECCTRVCDDMDELVYHVIDYYLL